MIKGYYNLCLYPNVIIQLLAIRVYDRSLVFPILLQIDDLYFI